MKLKNYFFLLLLVVFTFSANAQDMVPNEPAQASSVEISTPTHVTSIASRLGELVAPDNTPREAQDKRSLGNPVIIGKDRQSQDDYYVRNSHETEQSVRVSPPSLVFDAYSSSSSPTDPDMAVGPNHVFVTYNTAFVIYDKSGNVLQGPTNPSPAIFPSSGCCDLTVSYDNEADRWVVTFLNFGNSWVAVSDGPDPINDGWYIYDISFNDYNKLSIWSDGYYITENKNSTNKVYALERDVMLTGGAAQIMAFPLPGMITQGFWSPQFFDVTDGNMPAAGGATVVFLQDDAFSGISTDHVKLWTLDMDWGAGNGTMSAATELPATPFISVFDGGSFSNLSQPGGGADIDAIQNTVMNQARFMKFGSHNSAIFNFVIDTDASSGELAGIRWYELRQTGDNQPWTVYQEGTYTSPDGKHAWMASMNWDSSGNIGMGYSAMAGPTTPNPTDFRVGSYYTGRFDGDALGVMTANEEVIAVSTANVPNLRYCDYNKLELDTDGSTFWFIDEYINGGRKGVVGVFNITPNTSVDDIGATSIVSPSDGVLTANEDVTINIRNFGINDVTNPEVQYTINGGAAEVENYAGTIVAGATESFTFSAQADLSAAGDYTIVARTNLDGDTNPDNDEVSKVVTSGVIICEPDSDCSFGDGFTNVTIEEIDNDSGCEGYADFTNLSATLVPGSTYELTVTTGYGDQNVRVWIDFNDDGIFDNSTETVVPNFVIAPGQAGGTYTETVDLTIPGSVPTGSQHRMRLKSDWQNVVIDACADMQYGETEDYSANMGVLGTIDQNIVAADLMVLTLANNQFEISLTTEFEGIASIAISNILGQTLAFNNLEKEGNSYNYHLDMSYADAGVYFIKMGDNNSKTYKTAKIIVK